jgi:hypothetical protein
VQDAYRFVRKLQSRQIRSVLACDCIARHLENFSGAGCLIIIFKVDSENQIVFLQAMMNRIRFDDPKLRLFISQEIVKRQKSRVQEDISKEVIRRLRIQNKKLMEQVGVKKEQVKQIKKDKMEIQNRLNQSGKSNQLLAGALGSCSKCWGEDPDCSNCSGNGSPGWRNINRRLFNIYILPALEKVYGLSWKGK